MNGFGCILGFHPKFMTLTRKKLRLNLDWCKKRGQSGMSFESYENLEDVRKELFNKPIKEFHYNPDSLSEDDQFLNYLCFMKEVDRFLEETEGNE